MSRTRRRQHYHSGTASEGKTDRVSDVPGREDWSREILRPARRATRRLERLTRAGEVDADDETWPEIGKPNELWWRW